MVAFPGCKINLGLHILNRRPDGYHDIETVFYPLPWSDLLEFLPAKSFSFSTTGLDIPGQVSDNLCWRAYQLLQRDFSLPPVQGHLHKVVPMGAGLGGGSADGAHALRLLNELFSLGLSTEQLSNYARQLGSDCAYFLLNAPALGVERGDVLTPIVVSLAGYHVVVVKPSLHVATAEAYADIKPKSPIEPLTATVARPVHEWREFLVNDFEATVFTRHPALADLKARLYAQGAVYASMTGSGSAVFGLFRQPLPATADLPVSWSGTL